MVSGIIENSAITASDETNINSGGGSKTVALRRGFLVVSREHSNESLNVLCVFCKRDALIYKIADVGATTNVISVSATIDTVTITNNHAVACYWYTLGN